ncbi:hypothetical protein JAAARDRAFT_34199 [Jaapia argillacea MUCL 33604]|uniref:Sphingomyelin phosphodiesterase n=1 Tax=Jaapia argillacea MUCL 33604 TaxID=933084 RepID=A0A067Q739_9AGAM|nr:hypothetical protein JAAARDRAFT_34199 [Jaapia argillacea MUCL 33604]
MSILPPLAMLAVRLWFFVLWLCSFVTGSFVNDIIAALEQAVDCGSCHAALAPLQMLAHMGDKTFVKTIVAVCVVLRIEDPDVCDGAIAEQGPILAHSLRSISITGETATLLCDAVFGLCQPPPVHPLTIQFPKVEPYPPKQFVSSGKPRIQVAHFSDVHIDRQYTVGSETNCTKPICCRQYPDSSPPLIKPARENGEIRMCDTPGELADSMLEAVGHVAPDLGWAIFTGDVAEAAVWSLDRKEVSNDLKLFNEQLGEKLDVPVYGVFGNLDISPVNGFPRNTTVIEDAQWVFDLQSDGWAQWITSSSAAQLAENSGCYSSVVPGTNLRMVSISTNYWYKQNFWLYDSDTRQHDPNGILAFMVQELQAAEDEGQRAWIFGHMPMGGGDVLHDQSNYYNQIIKRYRNTIAGQFFGHTHGDHFQIAYSDYDNQTPETAMSFASIAPALTPRSGHPAFKIYDIDPDTYELMDVKVFYTNMTEPSFRRKPQWKLYYSAQETYGPLITGHKIHQDPLSPAFWHNLTEVFATNHTALGQFLQRRNRSERPRRCVGYCVEKTICDMRAFRSENNCVKVTPGVPGFGPGGFEDGDGEGWVQGDEWEEEEEDCEGVGIGRLFRKAIAGRRSALQSSRLLQTQPGIDQS